MTINISPETKIGKLKNYSAEDHMKGKIESYSIVDDNGKEYPPLPKEKFLNFVQGNDYSIAQMGSLS